MNTLDAFHMRCQRQILDAGVGLMSPMQRCFSDLVCQPSIGDILRHRRLSLFDHLARLDPGVPVRDALRLTVDTYKLRRQKGQLEKTAGSPSQRLAQQDSGGCQSSTAIYAVEI